MMKNNLETFLTKVAFYKKAVSGSFISTVYRYNPDSDEEREDDVYVEYTTSNDEGEDVQIGDVYNYDKEKNEILDKRTDITPEDEASFANYVSDNWYQLIQDAKNDAAESAGDDRYHSQKEN